MIRKKYGRESREQTPFERPAIRNRKGNVPRIESDTGRERLPVGNMRQVEGPRQGKRPIPGARAADSRGEIRRSRTAYRVAVQPLVIQRGNLSRSVSTRRVIVQDIQRPLLRRTSSSQNLNVVSVTGKRVVYTNPRRIRVTATGKQPLLRARTLTKELSKARFERNGNGFRENSPRGTVNGRRVFPARSVFTVSYRNRRIIPGQKLRADVRQYQNYYNRKIQNRRYAEPIRENVPEPGKKLVSKEAASWNPVIQPVRGRTGWQVRNEGVISEKVPSVRNLQARPIKKQMTIRKRTAPESKGEYWDALPTKTKEKIAKKAVKKVERHQSRRSLAGMAVAVSAADSRRENKDQEERLDPAAEQIFRTYRGARTLRKRSEYRKEKKYTLVNQEMNRMAKREAGKIAAKKKAQKQYRLKQQISRFQTQIIKKAEKAAHAVAAGAVKAARALTQMVAAGLGTISAPVAALLLLVSLIAVMVASLTGSITGSSGIDGSEVAAYAVSFEGKIPYLLGAGREYHSLEEIVAAGGMADCSAFTQRVFRHFNVEIGGSTYEQQNAGTPVEVGALEPGDLLLFDNHLSGPQPGHVGIYAGDGQVVHEGGANYTGNVKITSLTAFTVMSVRRIAVEGSGDFTGGNVQEICYNFFISQGFSEAAAAGVLGNIQWESGFNPAILEQGGADSGHGLCQWGDEKTGGRFFNLQAFADSRGKEWTDLETQLYFVIHELNGSLRYFFDLYAGGVEAYKNLDDPGTAALTWLKCYEMCGPYNAAIAHESQRVESAWNYYNLYG